MNPIVVPTTCRMPFILKHDIKPFHGGICLSNASFEALNTISNHYLHENEKNYFHSLTQLKRQHSYLLGRYCAKHAMAILCPKNSVVDVSIEPGVFQQPIVYCDTYPNLQVSISHTDTIGAAVAFPEELPIAIDIERICADKKNTLQSQMTDNEQKIISSSYDAPILRLTMFWTIKEALSKVLRCGLMMSFEVLEIKTMTTCDHITISDFKHFSQYQAMSFKVVDAICTIVYPRTSDLNIDIFHLQKTMNKRRFQDPSATMLSLSAQ